MIPSRQLGSSVGLFVKVLGVFAVVAFGGLVPVLAQEPPGRLFVNVLAPDRSLKDHPFTASAVCDGRIVFQQDGSLSAPPNKGGVRLDRLPLGLCDVRVESEGLVTEVKRGVQVFERDRTVEVVLRPGQGVHIVEFAEGGLAREEVAARLRALEADMEKVKGELDALSKRPQE